MFPYEDARTAQRSPTGTNNHLQTINHFGILPKSEAPEMSRLWQRTNRHLSFNVYWSEHGVHWSIGELNSFIQNYQKRCTTYYFNNNNNSSERQILGRNQEHHDALMNFKILHLTIIYQSNRTSLNLFQTKTCVLFFALFEKKTVAAITATSSKSTSMSCHYTLSMKMSFIHAH